MAITAKYIEELRKKAARLRASIIKLEESQKYKRRTNKFFRYLDEFIGGGFIIARTVADISNDFLHLNGFGYSSDTYSEPQDVYDYNGQKITLDHPDSLFDTIKRPRVKGWEQIKKKIQEEVAFENNWHNNKLFI